jgi:tetratricopeptide (TPR) repeat protein
MREAERAEHIHRLIAGIGLIGPGSMFERFGAKFLDHHLEVGLVHRGLNAQLNPVGGTVDSVDDRGWIAGEYSIEKDYFQARWEKPSNDLLHVVRTHPDVKDIYLLSSQLATAAGIKAAKARIRAWPGFADRTIHFYDARRIAEVIVDEMLLDDGAMRALAEHLPVLDRILNEHRATLTLPTVDPRRVALPSVEAAIDAALSDENPVVAISGVAGTGKSDAAAAYADSRRDRYRVPMWVEGSELAKVTDLSAQRLWRGGADLNVAGLLKSRACLLVIDDLPPEIALGDLKALCGRGSRILVTRRETAGGDISIPAFSPTEARQILDRDLSEPCPEPVLDALMRTVGGHPMSFALVNKAVATGVATWVEVGEDCDSIAEFSDGRERLTDRVLGRLKQQLATELTVFDWVGAPSCDHRFLKTAIRTPGMSKIRGQGLLAADRPAVVRLHDVVYASLKVQNWLTSERAAVLDRQLDDHLAHVIAEESLALLILATTMRAKLESIAAARFSPAVLLALLHLWRPEELDRGAVGEPEAHLADLETRGVPATYVETRFILESIECLYRADKVGSINDAKIRLAERLPLFKRLLTLKVDNLLSHAETRHHWAKALKILDRIDEASEQFEAVLSGPYPLDATRLQLIRLYAGKNDRAVELADEILTAAETPLTVISSVVLGVVENLSWAKGNALDELFAKHGNLIEREVIQAANAGLEQAYTALATVGRYWSWHEPERLRRIFDAVPVMPPEAADDRTSGALGEILLKLGKYPTNTELQNAAVAYFESIKYHNDFQLQKYGEVLIDLGRFPEAEAVLHRAGKIDTDAFLNYRLSQAMLGQGKADEALAAIELALARLQGDKYRASFSEQRFLTRKSQGDPFAVEDLDAAIAVCQPGKYLVTLQRRRAEQA